MAGQGDDRGDDRLSPNQLEKATKAIQILAGLDIPDTISKRSSSDDVLAAADRCLATFNNSQRLKSKPPSKRKAKDEVLSIFKRSKAATKLGESSKCLWKHSFVCLAYCGQTRIPTTEIEKDDLLRAGLGEKEVEFFNMEIGAEAFRDLLYDKFPPLRCGGGFEFLKCIPNSRNMEVLSPVTLSSPLALKTRVGTTKRTYIRPLQQDLELSAIFDLPSGPEEECLKCGEYFNLGKLASHISSCGRKVEIDLTDEYGQSSSKVKEENTGIRNDFEKEFDSIEDSKYYFDAVLELENDIVQTVMEQSSKEITAACNEQAPLMMKIGEMKKQIDTDETMFLDVRRGFVLIDAMRQATKKKFNPYQLLKIRFVGESAIDHGGPKREFFHLLALDVSNNYFSGADNGSRFLINNIIGVQDRKYYYLGVYFVLSVLYGGNGFPFMHDSLFNYLVYQSIDTSTVSVDNIPDQTLKFLVNKVLEAETDDDIQISCSIDESLDLLLATGFRKAVCNLTLEDRNDIRNALLNYHLIAKVKAELDQFAEGLQTFGFLSFVKADPHTWRPYFIQTDKELTPDIIKGMLSVEYSAKGSVDRPLEERTYMFFVDFLDDCYEEGISGCDLSNFLLFLTGTSRIPLLGFEESITLLFLKYGNFPTVSTCGIEIRLPTIHDTYEKFKDIMIHAIKGNDGFGGGP